MKIPALLPALLCGLFIPASMTSAHPDSTDTTAVRDSLRELSRKVDILTEEFESLRLADVTRQPLDTLQGGLGPASGQVYRHTGVGVSIAGYGEMVYENYDTRRADGSPSGLKDRIDFLRAVVYFGYRYNSWILFNSEIEFEHASTGEAGEVSVEFAYVELSLSRFANVRAGMLLAPIGIVNERHEPSTFFGTLRPQVERDIIPSTWRGNGAGLYGTTAHGIGYTLYVMEGLNASGYSASSGIRGGRQAGSKAIARNFALAGRVEYGGLPGTLIGASVYTGLAGQGAVDSLGGISAATTVVSAHGEFAWKGIELRGLFALTSVGDAGRLSVLNGETIGSRMTGWYVAGGYDIIPLFDPSSLQYLAPYVQYEQLNTQERVPSGFTADPATDRSVLTFGLMYKPHPNVAFKGDFRDNRNSAGTAVDQWNLAVNYLF